MVELLLMVQWVVGSILHGGPIELFLTTINHSSQCSTTGITKAMVCAAVTSEMWLHGRAFAHGQIDPLWCIH